MMKMQLEKQLIVLAGLPLTGKTSLGHELVTRIGGVFLDVDDARQELHPGKAWLGPDREREIMLEAYQLNHDRARNALAAGQTAILAATYSRPTYHKMITELASNEGVSLSIFLLEIPDDVVMERIEARRAAGSNSNIDSLESYSEVRDRYQSPEGATILDASQSTEEMANLVLRSID